jgi:hypothetical protein
MSKKLLKEIKDLEAKIAKQAKALRTLQGTLNAKVITLQGICKHPVNKVTHEHKSYEDTLGNYSYSDDWWLCHVCGATTEPKEWNKSLFGSNDKAIEFKKFTGKEFKYPPFPQFSKKEIKKAFNI